MNEELKQVNQKWNDAWLSKDVAVIERLAAEDYMYIGPQGQILDRAAILEIIRSPSYRLDTGVWLDVTISELDTSSAIVLDRFRGAGEYRGRRFSEDHRHTTVWVRRDAQWQVRLEHCSSIAEIASTEQL